MRERRVERPPSLVHEGWAETFPWLVQGTTGRGDAADAYDLGLFSGGSPLAEVRRRWVKLCAATGMRRVVHAHQVHGSVVRSHGFGAGGRTGGPSRADTGDEDVSEALALVEACDGHVTLEPGVLLAVTTADCVPVFLADPVRRLVGVLHAGWRGAVEGVAGEGLAAAVRAGASLRDLHVHLGPAICGACYEVGREVFEALGEPAPRAPAPIDLRRVLARRLVAAGVVPEHLTVSAHCTRCTGSDLFSHRGGDLQRQAGYIGIRA